MNKCSKFVTVATHNSHFLDESFRTTVCTGTDNKITTIKKQYTVESLQSRSHRSLATFSSCDREL